VDSCSVCGAAVPSGARFCPACGAAVEAGAGSEERKLATVLFADLVGSTELAGSQDPERTRALLERFYDAMAAQIREAGGTVEKFIGDAVVAVFGAPAAQEDHAERALHTALSMRRRLDELFGRRLALRIGVNTGDMVVGRPREGSSFVTGDAVNVAARLEQAAEPGDVLVGERTAAAVGGAFELGEPITVSAKGKPEGILARRLIRALSLMRPRGIAGLPPAFVGRDAELARLQQAYRDVAETRRPHVATVVGAAGIGKTTLVRRFWESLALEPPSPLRRTGRCLPQGKGAAYTPLGEIVREHLGLLESDAPETVRQRLGAHEMLGLVLGLEAPGDLHPLAARDRLHRAWVGFLEELLLEKPTVLLVEDLHWAEDALVDLLDPLVKEIQGPLLLLGTARPELVEQRPGWGGRGRESTWIELEPLSERDSMAMLEALIPTELPERLRDTVLRRAEGNPFFLEEVVATLIDQGVLQPEHGGWSVQEPADELHVPDTVRAVVSARVDLLAPPEKAALQAASVIGRVFWSGAVYELLGELEPDLRLLEQRDFIRSRPGTSIADEREFAIKHAVTREVAYESLPKARRARMHAAFADWLERLGEGRDEHAAVLAHHYAEAARPEDADLAWMGEDETLSQVRAKAVRWGRRAAELAVGRYEIDEAVSLLRRAIDLEDDPAGRMTLWWEIGHASALAFDAEGFSVAMQQTIELADSADAIADAYAELAFQALVRAGMWRTIPDPELVGGWIAHALELAEPGSPARAKALIARCYHDYEKSRELAAEASEAAGRVGDVALRSYGFDVRGLVAFVDGDYEEALKWQRRRLELAEQIDDPDHRADIYANAIAPCVAGGHFDEAARHTAAHEAATMQLSAHHRLHGVSAVVELDELLGRWERIREMAPAIERAVEANAATPCVRNPRSLLLCALASAHAGDDLEARRLEALADEHAMKGYGTVIDSPRIQLALQRGELDRVEDLLGEPSVRRSTWFYLNSMATHLDALAAMRDPDRVEAEASSVLGRSVYLEPFALRALGRVRDDRGLVKQAAEQFMALGMRWHAAETQLVSPSSSPG
jgi:class 3 adenylate cyclase/tetratricopeptide (TPR) repeat protein